MLHQFPDARHQPVQGAPILLHHPAALVPMADPFMGVRQPGMYLFRQGSGVLDLARRFLRISKALISAKLKV